MQKAKVKQTLSMLLIFLLMIMPISNVSVRADTPLVSSIIMETSKVSNTLIPLIKHTS